MEKGPAGSSPVQAAVADAEASLSSLALDPNEDPKEGEDKASMPTTTSEAELGSKQGASAGAEGEKQSETTPSASTEKSISKQTDTHATKKGKESSSKDERCVTTHRLLALLVVATLLL